MFRCFSHPKKKNGGIGGAQPHQYPQLIRFERLYSQKQTICNCPTLGGEIENNGVLLPTYYPLQPVVRFLNEFSVLSHKKNLFPIMLEIAGERSSPSPQVKRPWFAIGQPFSIGSGQVGTTRAGCKSRHVGTACEQNHVCDNF